MLYLKVILFKGIIVNEGGENSFVSFSFYFTKVLCFCLANKIPMKYIWEHFPKCENIQGVWILLQGSVQMNWMYVFVIISKNINHQIFLQTSKCNSLFRFFDKFPGSSGHKTALTNHSSWSLWSSWIYLWGCVCVCVYLLLLPI